MRMKKNIVISALVLALSACGSGNEKEQPTPIKEIPKVSATIKTIQQSNKVGAYVELALFSPQEQATDIKWHQTAGHAIDFLAERSKVIAFKPQQAGEYQFSVTFTDQENQTQTLNKTIVVEQESTQVTAALGRAILEGKMESSQHFIMPLIVKDDLKELWFDHNFQIEWQQVSGPTVNFTVDNKNRVFFDAPSVDQDTILEFELTATNSETTIKDTVLFLLENAPEISSEDNIVYPFRVASVFPYNENSKYGDFLANCVYSNTLHYDQICNFNTLPLLGQEQETPSLDDVLDRLLVSHTWMGDRFKKFMEKYDTHGDLKQLFASVSAIVISEDLTYSYQWALTGAIHLMPYHFAKSTDEWLTFSKSPDFRSNIGLDASGKPVLQYKERYSLLTNNFDYYTAKLLYHELAHANDAFPESQLSNLEDNTPIVQAYLDLKNNGLIGNVALISQYPLLNNELQDIGKVKQGIDKREFTDLEKSYNAADISTFFKADRAPQFYAYSSTWEYYATLFDSAMMKARYNLDSAVAVTNLEGVVDWGQLGRIGDYSVKPGVRYAIKQILPTFEAADEFVDSLPEPIEIEYGTSYRDWELNASPSKSAASHSIILRDSFIKRKHSNLWHANKLEVTSDAHKH